MTLKEIKELRGILIDLHDFFTTNANGDTTGLFQEVEESFKIADTILDKESYKLHLRNAKAKIKRRKG